jgi:hypothetical protein
VLHLFVMSPDKADGYLARLSHDPRERRASARRMFATPDRCFGCLTKLHSMMTRCTKCETPVYLIAD